jgi:aspartyl protease family protein
MGAWIGLGLLVFAGIALVLSHDTGTIAGFNNADFAGVMAAVALLIFLGGSMFGSYHGRFTKAVRDAVTWGVLALALVAGYSYRDQLKPVAQRIAGELLPGVPIQFNTTDANSIGVRIRKQASGQFMAQTHANGVKINMVVDTGASTIVLNPSDAVRAGIKLDELTYSVPVQTANGTSFAARVRLRNVSIGPVSIDNVEALIAKPGALRESLLGMSFLNRLRSYEFSGDFLTLRS